jgi:CXXC-20-CXXC protein
MRTCPNCGYKYSTKEFLVKIYPKSLNSEWNCPNCNAKLTFDVVNFFIIQVMKFLPVIFVNMAIAFLQGISGISYGWAISVYVLLSIIWMFIVSLFSKFTIAKTKKRYS